MSAGRALLAARAVWGSLLLARALRPPAGRALAAEPWLRAAEAVLGSRQLVEAAAAARTPGNRPPRWSIALDAVHAASMYALAAGSRRLRADALVSAAAATSMTAAAALVR